MQPARKPLPFAPLPIPDIRRSTAPKPRRSQSLKLFRRAMLVLMVFSLLATAVVYRQAQIAMGQRELTRLAVQVTASEALNARLQVEALALSSLERIERVAREELGMSNPQGSQIIRVGVVGGN